MDGDKGRPGRVNVVLTVQQKASTSIKEGKRERRRKTGQVLAATRIAPMMTVITTDYYERPAAGPCFAHQCQHQHSQEVGREGTLTNSNSAYSSKSLAQVTVIYIVVALTSKSG